MRELFFVLVSASVAACATSSTGPSTGTLPAAAETRPWSAPPLEQAVSVLDSRSGHELGFEALLDRLAEADAVFLGETHLDETTHRVELAIYEGLLARRSGAVVLALEMFERDVQPTLDAYLQGTIDEAEFLAVARPWGNYPSAYRPLIETARKLGAPVVASNFPRPLRRRIAQEGPGVLDELDESERRNAPAELHANTPGYWRRVDNAVRGHLEMMGEHAPDDPRLHSTQSLWDNSMGAACARALDEHSGSLVLHVNGGFHSAYRDGTVRQLLLRKPGARVMTVAIQPAANPDTVPARGLPAADFVVRAERRARDIKDGRFAVHVQRDVEYRLWLPDGVDAAAPVPLLIWFSDDGFTPAEGLALWRARVGAEAAIAVVRGLHRETQADLAEGGRWFYPDSFMEDVGALVGATERIWGYLLRHYPLDPRRVALAGEGAGATVVAAVSLLSERVSANAVAIAPRRYAKIKDFPLPLPELRGDEAPPAKSLQLLIGAEDEDFWDGEIAQYADIGFSAKSVRRTEDPFRVELESENALRRALGLAAREAAPSPRRSFVLVEDEASDRARLWARLFSLAQGAENGMETAVLSSAPDETAERIYPDIRPAVFAEGTKSLPRCPGAFGGSTVLVLPEGTSAPDLQAWLDLEEADPLQAESPFHRLRIATRDGAPDLGAVLAELASEGRKNVLIVPAAFCASDESMRRLGRAVDRRAQRMTLHWLPGLGGPAD